MEWFSSITHFFLDKERSIPKKTLMAIIIMSMIYFIDDAVGFTYYYNTEKKISQVVSINSAIQDNSIDSLTRSELIALRNRIISRKSIKIMSEDLLLSIIHPKGTTVTVQKGQKVVRANIPKPAYNKRPVRNNLLFMLSTSGIGLFIGLIVGIAAFFIEGNTLSMRIATAFSSIVLSVLWGLLWYWIGDLITAAFNGPINNKWAWNYWINLIVSTAAKIDYTKWRT